MDNKTESYTWGVLDAILLGLIWSVLLQPLVGFILGLASLPGRTKRSPGMIAVFSSLLLTALLWFQVNALLYELDDPAPPGPIRQLEASATATSLQVSWLASGDDEYTGRSRSYMGYALKPDSPSSFSPYEAADAGTLHSFELELTPSSQPRKFAVEVWAVDDRDKSSSHAEAEAEVPAASGIVYEDGPTKDAWTTEGKWAVTDAIDTDCPKVGKWWSNYFYEKDVQESITGSWIALPHDQPAELTFLAYCNLYGEDRVTLELKTQQKDWTSLKTFQGFDNYLGVQRIALDAWQGQNVQLRFRLESSQGGGRGFAFTNLVLQKVKASAGDEKPEQQS